MRGNHLAVIQRGQKIPGLSPRVRGNLPVGTGLAEKVGSIPARAGEPCLALLAACIRQGVYPRACGGT